MEKTHSIPLATRTGMHFLRLRIADTFASRLTGLLSARTLQQDEGLLITRCGNVHTIGMRMTIDVVYLGRDGSVLKCVSGLKPMLASWCKGAAMTLELAHGAIAHYGIAPGDQLTLPALRRETARVDGKEDRWRSQSGATMVEFIMVAPLITLLGLGGVEYGMLFFAKNNFNHASFMAARAGSTANASLTAVRDAYAKALIPQFGGGTNPTELQAAYLKAQASVNNYTRIEMLNPTKESFDDWNDTGLQNTIGKGKKVIPNANLGLKSQTEVRSNSGQNINDANMIKLRITHGYEPKVPFVGNLMVAALKLFDDGSDSYKTALYDMPRPGGGTGFIPVVSDVTLKMQSDAIEPDNPVSLPGPGNGGTPPTEPPAPPTDPSTPPAEPSPPTDGGGPFDPGNPCEDPVSCQLCPVPLLQTATTDLPADILFDFDKSTLTADGKAYLDNLINKAKNLNIQSMKLTGHTDQFGPAEYNMNLSIARAQTVKDYLLSHGLPDVNITVIGKGATEPKKELSECPGSIDVQKVCLAANRRVSVEYSYLDPT